MSKEERQELKNDSIVILPVDKGSCTVAMDKAEYHQKVTTMFDDGKTYTKLKKDPSEKTKKQLIKKLTTLKEQNKITEGQYRYLYPTTNNIPRLYCTPQKIHKQNNLLRPIMDYSGSANYNLGRVLVDLLNPLMGKTKKTEHQILRRN